MRREANGQMALSIAKADQKLLNLASVHFLVEAI